MIWLIGCNGMLGQQLKHELTRNNLEFIGTDFDVDITNPQILSDFAKGKDIKWILNCSAYTAVDKAESDQEKAELINGVGVENIATLAQTIGAKVIHFSTDYVFDGKLTGAYTPTDTPNPVSVYGKTKLSGEKYLQKECNSHFIIRIAWLYGVYGNNFVSTMLRLFSERDSVGVVADQYGTPTYCGKLAENIISLIQSNSDKYGIYHYTDEGKISWHEFAQGIKAIAIRRGLDINNVVIKPIPTIDYPTPAERPQNSFMDKSKVIKELGFEVLDWQKNLEVYFTESEHIL